MAKKNDKLQAVEKELAEVKGELAFYQDKGKLTLVPGSPVSKEQILTIFQKTPPRHIYTRPAKGGGTWDYVTATYVKKVLNYVFGFMWSFEVVQFGKEEKQVWILGKLTVKDPKSGLEITKSQFGRADIKYKKQTNEMLDYGNDLKAATSDALKKCAAEFGIASDIYGKNEFKEVSEKEAPKEKKEVIKPETIAVKELCQNCFEESSKETQLLSQVASYSRRVYGRPLCVEHQKSARKQNENEKVDGNTKQGLGV